MLEKSGFSFKRPRQNTETDAESLLKDIERYRNISLKQEKDIEALKETLKHTKQDLNKSQIENEKLQSLIRELLETQKLFVEQLDNQQKMLHIILIN